MSRTNVNMNTELTELSTMLMVCMLINRKEILLTALWNVDVAKGVVMSWTHVEPRNVQTLNETTFLVTYASGILADEIGSAVEKIGDWLGKPVVITCDEVTLAQLPGVIEHVQQIRGAELVAFNNRMDDLQADSIHSVQHGYPGSVGVPAVPEASGATILNKIPGIYAFQVLKEKRILFSLNSGIMPFLMLEGILMNTL